MKYVAIVATVIFLMNPINANAFGLGDLSKAANFAKSAKQVTTPTTTDANRCDPIVASPEALDAMTRAKSMATKKAIEIAINRLTTILGGTEPVGMINSYCDVDKKLVALEAESIRLGNYVKASTQKSLDALANGSGSATGDAFADTSGSISSITKAIKKNTKKAAKGAKKAKNPQGVNNALLQDAIADLNASLKPAALLLAHDLTLANFIKDNPKWAVENVGQAKLFITQINLLLASGTAVRKIQEAALANERLGVDTDALAAASLLKEQALEIQAAAELANYDL